MVQSPQDDTKVPLSGSPKPLAAHSLHLQEKPDVGLEAQSAAEFSAQPAPVTQESGLSVRQQRLLQIAAALDTSMPAQPGCSLTWTGTGATPAHRAASSPTAPSTYSNQPNAVQPGQKAPGTAGAEAAQRGVRIE